MTADLLPVDPSNRDQLRGWDGDEGAYWAAHPDHFERALAGYDESLFAAASIARDDRVLDVGCGTGKTSREAARAAAEGSVLGVDLSSAMIEAARRRAAAHGLHNVRFEQADAQVHPFEPGAFDVAIACTSAMFFGDRAAALANIGRSLRPEGRLVLLTWQPFPQQEWIREFSAALAAGRDLPAPPAEGPGPFSLAEPDVIRSVLVSAGYTDVVVEGHRASMWFGTDADDAYEFVLGLVGWMAAGLDEPARRTAHAALRTAIAAHESPDGVCFDSAAWLTRARRP